MTADERKTEEKRRERSWQLECERIDKRNKLAQKRIEDHDKLKETSRAYQEGGAWHNRTTFGV